MTQQADDNPGDWAERPPSRDDERARVTSGASGGTSGARLPARAWLAVAAFLGLAVFVNVTTLLDDARRHGVLLPISLPLTLEMTSALGALAAAHVIVTAMRLAPPGRRPLWRMIAVHAVGTVVYSALHVSLMTLLRTLAFGSVGRRYSWTPQELPYEYRKDVLTYVVIAGLFWILTRQGREAGPPEPPPKEPADEDRRPAGLPVYDIRDGASILRLPVREILAARAAGNYVEFALEDGRRPLMRASMARIETDLAPHGFVRTHRSWLVNGGRVRALSAAGSGDFRLDLGCGLTAPLSRRYPAALARLRGEG
jgi:hypothetical protein